jgi:hypothetical protein
MNYPAGVFFSVVCVAATAAVGSSIYNWTHPLQRALRKARRGDREGVEAFVKMMLKKGESAACCAAIGEVYLCLGKFREARLMFGRAVELGNISPELLASLKFAILEDDRFARYCFHGDCFSTFENAPHLPPEDFELLPLPFSDGE